MRLVTTRGRRRESGPVGVLAPTLGLAQSLASEMGIRQPVILSPRSVSLGGCRGSNLAALLVEESSWPLTEEVENALLPCLAQDKGYVLRIRRYEPGEESA